MIVCVLCRVSSHFVRLLSSGFLHASFVRNYVAVCQANFQRSFSPTHIFVPSVWLVVEQIALASSDPTSGCHTGRPRQSAAIEAASSSVAGAETGALCDLGAHSTSLMDLEETQTTVVENSTSDNSASWPQFWASTLQGLHPSGLPLFGASSQNSSLSEVEIGRSRIVRLERAGPMCVEKSSQKGCPCLERPIRN